MILAHAPNLFTHWSGNVRQVYHRLLIYKSYRSRRMYLPVWNSCEWMGILNGILQKRYHPSYKESEDTRAPDLMNVTMDEMNRPSVTDPKTEAKYRAFRSRIFHTDLGSEYGRGHSFVAQQLILDAYHTIDLEIYNRRTNEEMRTKRLRQIIQVSEKREAQAIDLVIANLELKFFKEYVGMIDQCPNMYTFQDVDDTFNEEFLWVCPEYMQRRIGVPVTFCKDCKTILPENLKVGEEIRVNI